MTLTIEPVMFPDEAEQGARIAEFATGLIEAGLDYNSVVKHVTKEYGRLELNVSLCLEQHIDEEMQRAILTLETMRRLKPLLRYMELEQWER